MTLNSAKIVGLLLGQEVGKRLAAVMRPCEVRALGELAKQDRVSLENLVTISIDCLGSHDEGDYEQRVSVWGNAVPTRESLRWSRKGQIASYRFRQACQVCEQPYCDEADITIGLFGQNVSEKILVYMETSLAEQVGLCDNGWTQSAGQVDLDNREMTVVTLVTQRRTTRRRLLGEIQDKAAELTQLLDMFGSCTLCGKCQEACPLTITSDFEMTAYQESTPEYAAARLLDLARRSESCAGCGMCEAACHLGLPLMLVSQMLAEQIRVRQEIIQAFSFSA